MPYDHSEEYRKVSEEVKTQETMWEHKKCTALVMKQFRAATEVGSTFGAEMIIVINLWITSFCRVSQAEIFYQDKSVLTLLSLWWLLVIVVLCTGTFLLKPHLS